MEIKIFIGPVPIKRWFQNQKMVDFGFEGKWCIFDATGSKIILTPESDTVSWLEFVSWHILWSPLHSNSIPDRYVSKQFAFFYKFLRGIAIFLLYTCAYCEYLTLTKPEIWFHFKDQNLDYKCLPPMVNESFTFFKNYFATFATVWVK